MLVKTLGALNREIMEAATIADLARYHEVGARLEPLAAPWQL
jgi:hypothetical protein